MQCGANRGRVNDLRAWEVATHQARGHLVSHPDTLLMARLSTLILVVAAHVAALNPSDRARPAVSSRRAQFPAPKPELVASTSTGLQLGGLASPEFLFVAATLFSCASVGVLAEEAVKAAGPTLGEVMKKASKRALGGGISGAIAGVIQVCTLMWLRTTMNYQYRYGTSTGEAMAALWKQGGIGRFYQGLPYAIMQAPLSRFGDTAANTGVLALLEALAPDMAIGMKTAFASMAGSLWRILITPIDTLKTTLQVEGPAAMMILKEKMAAEGPMILYNGAIGNAVASFVGSYPWYFTFNFLQQALPKQDELVLKLLRNAACGFGATCVSDVTSNFIRVLKTTVQTSAEPISYVEAAQQIIEKEGVLGLFARGLGTRLLTNGIQASLFSVLWKLFEDMFANKGL